MRRLILFMISPSQLSNLRDQAARVIEQSFPVDIEIDGQVVPAARYRSTSTASHILDGMLPEIDVRWRIRRDALPAGVSILPETTLVREGAKSFRVASVTDSVGDPCLLVQARAL